MELWIGFHSFFIELMLRANEGGWNAAALTRILTYGGHLLLENYHAVTKATLQAACAAPTNNRVKQNAKVMFFYTKSSISDSIKTTIKFGRALRISSVTISTTAIILNGISISQKTAKHANVGWKIRRKRRLK